MSDMAALALIPLAGIGGLIGAVGVVTAVASKPGGAARTVAAVLGATSMFIGTASVLWGFDEVARRSRHHGENVRQVERCMERGEGCEQAATLLPSSLAAVEARGQAETASWFLLGAAIGGLPGLAAWLAAMKGRSLWLQGVALPPALLALKLTWLLPAAMLADDGLRPGSTHEVGWFLAEVERLEAEGSEARKRWACEGWLRISEQPGLEERLVYAGSKVRVESLDARCTGHVDIGRVLEGGAYCLAGVVCSEATWRHVCLAFVDARNDEAERADWGRHSPPGAVADLERRCRKR